MRKRLAACGLLLLVLCAYFFPLLKGHQLGQSHILWESHPWLGARPTGLDIGPRNSEGDAATVFHPILTVAREQVLDGRFPLWNPYSYSGMVLHADVQSALLFPLTWLVVPLGVEGAWGVIALLKLLVAGTGAYALGRHLGIARRGAWLAALVYMLCAPLVLWLQWPLATVFALFPWLLLATTELCRRPGPRPVAGLASVVTLSILAGHPETALLSSSAAAVFLAFLVSAGSRLRSALRFLAAHVLALGASAVSLLPFLEAYADSITRYAHGSEQADLNLPLEALVLFLAPNVYGDGRPDYEGPFGLYVLGGGYFGVLALLLALVAIVRLRGNPVARALLAMALTALAVAFGVPPLRWIVENVPPYADGNHLRVLYIVALAGALGAGAGLESLLRRPLAPRHVAIAAGAVSCAALLWFAADQLGTLSELAGSVKGEALLRFCVLVALSAGALWLPGRAPPTAAVILVVLLAGAELLYLRGFNVVLPAAEAYPGPTPALTWLDRRPRPFRMSTMRPQLVGLPDVLPPNTSATQGLESVQGYDYPQSKRWADFSWFVLGERGLSREIALSSARPSGAALASLRMLNTRYYLAKPGEQRPDPGLEPAYRGRDATIFRDPEALPRAYVVPTVRRVSDRSALSLLRRGRIDPRREALVPPDAPPARGSRSRAARVERVAEDHVRVHVPPGSGGWLVLADAYSPQWKAEVDGRETELFPTNFAVMGVPVSPRARTVDFRLSRSSLVVGSGISLLSLALIAALALRRRPARR